LKKNQIPKYQKILLKKFPDIVSGRKNFEDHNLRILKTLRIIKNYFKKINN
tara:strand:- start:586 stop:738 length:153 start_codon:yes stop_codon:yes gene_type:complete